MRKSLCELELVLNRRFAPELYRRVVPITHDDGGFHVDGPGEPVEYALVMSQFDTEAQLDRMLRNGELEPEMMARFGRDLARLHDTLPRAAPGDGFGTSAILGGQIDESLRAVRQSPWQGERSDTIRAIEEGCHRLLERDRGRIEERSAQGFVRECHGDLHLTNMMRFEGRVRAFDCIEFNPVYRWIDVLNDLAFLAMDCEVRDRRDLSYLVVDRYLEESGSYGGMGLFRLYLAYRSLVRAKVAALGGKSDLDHEKFRVHLDWAASVLEADDPAKLVITSGLSGSGKSWLAGKLIPALPAIRVRSDVERKRLAGSGLVGELYDLSMTRAVYDRLLDSARASLVGGRNVIVDAAFLRREERERFRELATECGAPFALLHVTAPRELLRRRIVERRNDPSDATVEVLDLQETTAELPTTEELPTTVRSDEEIDLDALARRLAS